MNRFSLCSHCVMSIGRNMQHMARLSTMEKAVKIQKIGIESATYSVGSWVDYCSFCMLTFSDPHDVRRMFQRCIFSMQDLEKKIGDIKGARAAFQLCDTESDSTFIETAIKEANMEKRVGNSDTALDINKKTLKMAAIKREIAHHPYIVYSLFPSQIPDAAMNLLISGVQQFSNSRLLLQELINFAMMHEGSRHLRNMDRIVATTISCQSESLSSKDREDLSHLYLKFVDHRGTTHDIRKAWNRHIKSFPLLINKNYLFTQTRKRNICGS